MKTDIIRQTFLNYFADNGHTILDSSSLIPDKDPTLLFTNAGMNQFKDVFLGQEKRDYKRATTSQCCVRAGGKHNDLENVGFTARHHTFFEMLGNFSFGDYFKREAIQFGWKFLTEILKLPKEKLWVTVYEDDDEAEEIWLKEIKVDPKRVTRCGAEDNFWAMGDTGPCGPCSEIFYDHGEEVAGGPPGSEDADGDRYVEIWNLVFMQFNRTADGKLTPLPKPSIDTGMGLERIAAIMQGVHSNYEIDIFKNLIKEIKKLTKVKDKHNPSYNVIADHIRSAVFLITDGVKPSNDGRGYVLRRIIRRAIRHGNKLGAEAPFFYKLVVAVVAEMSEAYPKIKKAQRHIEHVLQAEEKQFDTTLEQGLRILKEEMAMVVDNVISGEAVFKLYDTYGFPADMTRDIARENDLEIDEQGFTREMLKQREQSKKQQKFTVDYSKVIQLETKTKFLGYEQLACDAKTIALIHKGEKVEFLRTGDAGAVVLDVTPFYAEAGGQVGDIGRINTPNSCFHVTDTQKRGDVYFHYGYVDDGSVQEGFAVTAEVDSQHRHTVELNHSATHLLHAALRQTLGEHVEQKGSLVTSENLRFDFSHLEPVTTEQLLEVEKIVNAQIRLNFSVCTQLMGLAQAKTTGAMALFGEKYAGEVRVVNMGEFSTELCGGTHVAATGSIGVFKITSESGIAAGIRRIEAITGEHALGYFQKLDMNIKTAARMLKSEPHHLVEKLQQMLEYEKANEKQLRQLKARLTSIKSNNLTANAKEINGINVISAKLDSADMPTLRSTIDELKHKLDPAIILLATVVDNKILIAAGVSKSVCDQFHAGKLMQYVVAQLGGEGGGRPDMAQGGGIEVPKLDAALKSVFNWTKKQ